MSDLTHVPYVLTDQEIEYGLRLCDWATPAPWRWRFPAGRSAGGPELTCPLYGLLLVLDAVRDGMNRATLRFARRTPADRGGLMDKAARYCVGSGEPVRSDWPVVENPDMEFMAFARGVLPAALRELKYLRAELLARTTAALRAEDVRREATAESE